MSNLIWFYIDEDWKKGELLSKKENLYYVRSEDSNELEVKEIQTRNDNEIDNCDNLINLPHLNEASVLNGLSLRYNEDNIYTKTGEIIIAVNPYKETDLYSENNMKMYRERKENLAPHIYETAIKAYDSIKNNNRNQSILISGESGAGKTQSTKILMEYLSRVSSCDSDIARKIVSCNPILEAFGNAKTLRNNNSSRFGKFINLQFNKNNELIGANIETYLLEKIRVVNQNDGENNFHIFYQLIKDLDENDRRKYMIKDINYYDCLNKKENYEVDTYHDLKYTMDSFRYIGFKEDIIDNLFSIISSILLLRNVKFKSENSNIKNISKLLKVEEKYINQALYIKKLNVNNEKYEIENTETEFNEVRDSLCMKMYEKIFNIVVKKINNVLNSESDKFIGILDIFGFETFFENYFEQLCINYTNESLQYQFNQYIFKKEQELYSKENIKWNKVDFKDNSECINLIEGNTGIFKLLDEECMMPKGNENNLLSKIIKCNRENENFGYSNLYRNSYFDINHYAGNVKYNILNFVKKNTDYTNNDINDFISKIDFFGENRDKSSSRIKMISVTSQFKSELKKLIMKIDSTDIHYIRCIKPNDKDMENNFDRKKIIRQLRYCGIIEAIRISRAGYPFRLNKESLLKKYWMICEEREKNMKNIIKNVKCSDYQEGNTMIFFKQSGYNELENMRLNTLGKKTVLIQKEVRMFICRRKYKRTYSSIIRIQSCVRMLIAKNMKLKILKTLIIQKNCRMIIERKKYVKYRKQIKSKILIIQKNYRRYIYRKKFLKIKESTRVIERYIYNFLQLRKNIKEKNKLLEKNVFESKEIIEEISNKLENTKKKVEKMDKKLKEKEEDIELAKKCIVERTQQKADLMDIIDKLVAENKSIQVRLEEERKIREESSRKRTIWEKLFG